MTTCAVQASGAIELYFYDELDRLERQSIADHVESCRDCRAVLADLAVIRTALAERRVVSAPAAGDWSGFMSRLDAAIASERTGRGDAPTVELSSRSPYLTYLAVAALLALVTFSVATALRSTVTPVTPDVAGVSPSLPAAVAPDDARAFRTLSDEHFDRSKLVVLGLATKDTERGQAADWAYERTLATSLLNDTRIYRLTAEDRGLTALAGVMRDLELVLLQTSLTDEKDPDSLPQLQRLIEKRDLLEKMDVVTTTGL
jgi:hypothetical protein